MKPYFPYYESEAKVINHLLERRVLAHTEDMMMVELSAKSGAVIPIHQHIHVQMTYILEGVFEIDLNGAKMILKKGDSLFIESNQTHGSLCLSEGKLLDVFTPARKDFL
ncbi:MAG: cupin domain-containing protein [Acholeplasmataceae bacterium]|nr:cupin domain-containing protein [Acholeplasmataceae bacterium]